MSMSMLSNDQYYSELVPLSYEASTREEVPGRGWLALAGAVAVMMLGRQLIWRFGLRLDLRVIAGILAVLTLGLVAMAARRVQQFQAPLPPMHAHGGRLFFLFLWVMVLTASGLFHNNLPTDAIKSAVALLMLILMLYLGRYDAVWRAIRKPLIITFYAGAVLLLLTFRLPHVVTTLEGSQEKVSQWDARNIDTIGYSVRPVLEIGLLLAAWGLVQRRTDRWRILQLCALPVVFAIDVLIFAFRSSALSLVGIVMTFTLLLPMAQKRLRPGVVVAVLFSGLTLLALASPTHSFQRFIKRFSQEQGVFDARLSESRALFEQLDGIDILVGRGLGGWYEGPSWAPAPLLHGVRHWQATHLGFLQFVLVGGIPFLLLASSFVVPVIFRKPPGWYSNEHNLAAFLLAPTLIVQIVLNPVSFDPDGFFVFFTWAFCFSRFAAPVTELHE
jgi:hypothetical protein